LLAYFVVIGEQTMEDALTMQFLSNQSDVLYLAVFDGHGGDEVACLANTIMVDILHSFHPDTVSATTPSHPKQTNDCIC
jgi:serine/threonine protein phosphatase PrpC